MIKVQKHCNCRERERERELLFREIREGRNTFICHIKKAEDLSRDT